jgi:ABC-type uncharacterized transport system YnjBCD ATPase subunit
MSVALVGDNCAGKSTLIKAIAGIEPADARTFSFDGARIDIRSPAMRRGSGSRRSTRIDNLDTAGNLLLGREPVGPARLSSVLHVLDEPAMEGRAVAQMYRLGVTTLASVRTPVATLWGGQRQAVAVARATLWDARLVILDEPTTALGSDADRARPRPDPARPGAEPRRRRHLAQHRRRLRGGRPDRRPLRRATRGHLRARDDDTRRGDRRDRGTRPGESLQAASA